MKKISVKKGQILQSKGDFHRTVYSVELGLLRSYSIDEKGKEHIYMFAPEGWIIGDAVPVGVPNELFIDALENTVVVEEQKKADVGQPNVDKLIRRLAVLQNRVIMLMSASAIERYEHFLATYPDIVQRVPQKMVASYLGITPEALSAAKRKKYATHHLSDSQ